MGSNVETPTEILPFHFDVPQEELDDLRRRIHATRWPNRSCEELRAALRSRRSRRRLS